MPLRGQRCRLARVWWRLVLVLVVLAGALGSSEATADAPLRVGTKETPPFVIRQADGTLDGPSLQLWRELAADLGVTYELQERDLAGLLDGLRDGSLDVAVAAITVTSEREATLDFSHPYHTTGLAIAARRARAPELLAVLGSVLSRALLPLVGLLAALQLVVGTIMWALERRRNPEDFGGSAAEGVFSGFWWSTVTMTTVGYGDKAPKTAAGRLVALAWMLCSVVIISTFTATVASQLTLARLTAELSGPDDLDRVRVGVITDTTSERWARGAGLDFRRFDDVDSGLAAVDRDQIDALVHDAPLLEQALRDRHDDRVEVLPARFQRQDYAIALPEGSELREPINRLLPDKLRHEGMGEPSLLP